MRTTFKNCTIYGADFEFHPGCFSVQDGVFSEILTETSPVAAPDKIVDLEGCRVIPGLVDLNTYGNTGHSFMSCDGDGYQAMTDYLLKNGITSFAAGFGHLSAEHAAEVVCSLQSYAQAASGSTLRGLYIDGFFSAGGDADSPFYVRQLEKLLLAGKNLPSLLIVSPEIDKVNKLLSANSRQCRFALGHTNADHIAARLTFAAGASHLTHAYNNMTGLTSVNGGPIGAANEMPNVTIDLICDGISVHEATVRATYRLFGGPRIAIVSASSPLTGLPNGSYHFGLRDFTICDLPVKRCGPDNRVTETSFRTILDADGNPGGSVLNLFETLRCAISMGIRPEAAIRGVTEVPARVLGIDSTVGSIRSGLSADFVVIDSEFNIKCVYHHGHPVA